MAAGGGVADGVRRPTSRPPVLLTGQQAHRPAVHAARRRAALPPAAQDRPGLARLPGCQPQTSDGAGRYGVTPHAFECFAFVFKLQDF